ncbi:hypothetical protein L0666_05675 [Octadecabacter sp. CECT 8868]|uniref:hypothetical protein n=1 Tax=Octadecabacter algicola TaxID=2909342 RepID=UPI001F3DB4CB|nr:hypothetical protein [Octadecabacter algicola]MCF2904468.1 hypothetical protein [Octadecabacter algicola]
MSEAKLQLVNYALADVENALRDQSSTLHNLRIRTSYLLTLNGLVLSFFARDFFSIGRVATNNAEQSDSLLIGWIAIGFAVVAVVLCIMILIPKGGWVFSNSTKDFLEKYVFVDEEVDELESKAMVSLMRFDHYKLNEGKLTALQSLFLFAAILVFCQMLFWIIGEIL